MEFRRVFQRNSTEFRGEKFEIPPESQLKSTSFPSESSQNSSGKFVKMSRNFPPKYRSKSGVVWHDFNGIPPVFSGIHPEMLRKNIGILLGFSWESERILADFHQKPAVFPLVHRPNSGCSPAEFHRVPGKIQDEVRQNAGLLWRE